MSEDQKKSSVLAETVEERLGIAAFIVIGIPTFMYLVGVTVHPTVFLAFIVAAIVLTIWSSSAEKSVFDISNVIAGGIMGSFMLVHLIAAVYAAGPHNNQNPATVDTVIEYANENGYSEIRLEARHSPKFRENPEADFTIPTRTIPSQVFIYHMRESPVFEELDSYMETPVEGEEVCWDIGSIRGEDFEACRPRVNNIEIRRPMIIALDGDGEVVSVAVEQG